MRGREVFEFAVTKGAEIINKVLAATAVDKEQLRYVVVHQANINIISELSRRLGIQWRNSS
jgi:3-oxoacyl-[acyl-carrier-protein] synthase-3